VIIDVRVSATRREAGARNAFGRSVPIDLLEMTAQLIRHQNSWRLSPPTLNPNPRRPIYSFVTGLYN
jgi:hypothetical protein